MERPGYKMVCAVSFLIALMLMVGASNGDSTSAAGAKSIFFAEGGVAIHSSVSKPGQKHAKKTSRSKPRGLSGESYLGLSYWIDLIDRDGKFHRTTTSRVFRSGDRIKLNIKSNRDGYLYVVGVGSSGSSRVLYPNSEGISSGIKASTTYSVPFDTNLKFDDTPGEEKLIVMLSERPLQQFIPGQRILPAQEARRLVASAHVPGSKDLVLEEEVPETAIEPASYAVVPISAIEKEGVLSLQIKLKHR